MSESNGAAQPGASPEKDPSDWVTGDEPATGAQRSYLETLTRQTDDDVPEDLTKAEASKKIDDLKNG
jgi:glucose-6-phosphate isomerase